MSTCIRSINSGNFINFRASLKTINFTYSSQPLSSDKEGTKEVFRDALY